MDYDAELRLLNQALRRAYSLRLDDLICETIPGFNTPLRGRRYYGLPELGWIIACALACLLFTCFALTKDLVNDARDRCGGVD